MLSMVIASSHRVACAPNCGRDRHLVSLDQATGDASQYNLVLGKPN